MNILILGSGGREHAFAWKISQSPLCDALYIAPGNPGTDKIGTNVDLGILDFEAIEHFCLTNEIKLIVVGPEEPLVRGIYDYFQKDHLKHIIVIGPSQKGAQLEGSKAFAKEFMQRNDIPTANYKEFTTSNYEEGIIYLKQHSLPIVLKADGLAAGKGVVIAETHDAAIDSFKEMLQDKKFGEAGSKVVVEEFLTGIECSVFVLTNGIEHIILPNAKDYKRIGEQDKGLNTGGMGAISPVPFATDEFMQKVSSRIIEPTISGLQKESIIYHGFIFIGLIMVNNDPFVIEYNCRMGDPETEVVLPRLENDMVEIFTHLHANTLSSIQIKHSSKHAATIVLVSGGYPEHFEKGKEIKHVDKVENCIVFHAGTTTKDEKLVTNGGRVIAITALSDSLSNAISTANSNAEIISYEGKYYRKDIGWEFS